MKQSIPVSAATPHPTHEQISRRAEDIWRKQGSPANHDEEIWLEAERQLQQESVATRPTGARRTSKHGHGGSTPPMGSR